MLVVDAIGGLPLERQPANLLFALVALRCERGSAIVPSNRSFEQWGEMPGDATVAAAPIDRPVHHATMIGLEACATACASARARFGPGASRPGGAWRTSSMADSGAAVGGR